jgi:hypothetical protein
MKQLQLVKTPPNQTTQALMLALGEGKDVTRFNLYEDADYAKLVQLIFANDEIISWW